LARWRRTTSSSGTTWLGPCSRERAR
jgi:hypothetical protein